MIEISELNFNDDHWDNSPSVKSTNFGGGLELLMNDKVKENSKPTSDIDLEDINNLENELNDLVDDNYDNSFKPKSDFFNNPNSSFEKSQSVRFDENSIGQSTAETMGETKTWDGYAKFNNIPMNPDKHVSSHPQISKEELLKEKFKYLRKLEALEKKGLNYQKNIQWNHLFKKCKVNMKLLWKKNHAKIL